MAQNNQTEIENAIVNTNAIDYGSPIEHITALVRAKIPYIWVTTFEEGRFLRSLEQDICGLLKQQLWTWSSYSGLIEYDPTEEATKATGDLEKTNMPNIALNYIEQYKFKSEDEAKYNGSIWVLKDFHTVLAQPIPRQLRDIRRTLARGKKTIIFLAPYLAHGPGGSKPGLDPTLEKSIVVVPYELPSREYMERRIRGSIQALKSKSKGSKVSTIKTEYTSEEYERFTTSLQGLTEQEADTALLTCITHLDRVDEKKLLREKKQIIQKSEILEYIGQTPSMADVGGLDLAKQYFATYSNQFSKEAEAYGVDPLRGVLMVGVCGCLRGDTPIYNPSDGTTKTIRERHLEAQSFSVYSLNTKGEKVMAIALPPVKYSKAKMITFQTEEGTKITTTETHRFLGPTGWIFAHELFANVQQYGSALLLSNQGSNQPVLQPNALHLTSKEPGSRDDYQSYPYSCDEQPRREVDNGRAFSPLPNDVHGHNHSYLSQHLQRKDVPLEHGQECSRFYQQCVLPSRPSFDDQDSCILHQNVVTKDQPLPVKFQVVLQSHSGKDHCYRDQLPTCLVQVSRPAFWEEGASVQPCDNSLNSPYGFVLQLPAEQVCSVPDGQNYQGYPPLQQESFPVDKGQRLAAFALQSTYSSGTSWNYSTRYTRIVKAEYADEEEYFDFHVPGYENYEAVGLWHHNCGKSLIAKAIAAQWSLPLLRLDVGKVMQGLVGSSEMNMRTAISQLEACAPAICWLDEIEKALSGTKSSNFSDGGTLSRVFGTLLTAMEERMKGIVVIATSNDIQALPPELIRRFNEVMFVDLPSPEEREEIFRIHLRKRNRDVNKLDLNMVSLVEATNMYTGSEIEKAVKEAIARAFQTGKKDLGQEELMGAIKDTKCIAKVMSDQINAIRDWAREKARYASSYAKKASSTRKITTKNGKQLDLNKELDDMEEIGKKDTATEGLDLPEEMGK